MTTAQTTASPGAQTLASLNPRVTHVAYHVSDIDRALAFYVGVLGMKEQMRLPLGKGVHEVVLGFPESKAGGLILMWNTERSVSYQLGDGYSRIVLSVSDLDAALSLLAQHATPVAKAATEAGPFRYALVKDPDGYVVELLQLKR
jgi:catechol 2,3-dioxygenase-like lactoylglutathione lyase family enzyme